MHVDHREAIPILHVKYRAQFLLGVGWGGMSYWVYVTLSCHNWKRIDFRYSGAYYIYYCCVSHKCILVGYSRHKKKTTFIGGMELVSLRCNRDFTSASSYRLGWYKYAIATQWYQFHTTDAWWFSLNIMPADNIPGYWVTTRLLHQIYRYTYSWCIGLWWWSQEDIILGYWQ